MGKTVEKANEQSTNEKSTVKAKEKKVVIASSGVDVTSDGAEGQKEEQQLASLGNALLLIQISTRRSSTLFAFKRFSILSNFSYI